ncbi:MAG: hypothetical protein JF591_15165, partial [Lysobacter sp.]|nr:hypothetical protein [Lysobacter sp.]
MSMLLLLLPLLAPPSAPAPFEHPGSHRMTRTALLQLLAVGLGGAFGAMLRHGANA